MRTKQTYMGLPDLFGKKWEGARVFHFSIETGGEVYDTYSHTKLTQRQFRQIRRQLRNYTLAVFDNFAPDPLDANRHRMKGARQAYARREKIASMSGRQTGTGAKP